MNCRIVLSLLVLTVISQTGVSPLVAGDWPQFMGPTRNGRAADESLAADWNSSAPKQIWNVPSGEGYAGIAVQGDQALLFQRRDSAVLLTCLSTTDGTTKWETRWAANYPGGMNADDGPRCTPLIHDNHVYVFDAGGDLHCANLLNGKKVWSRQLLREYRARTDTSLNLGYFGCGSTPIVVRDKLIVCLGGADGAGVVSLDLASGETQWTSVKDSADYASPCLWKTGNQENAIIVSRKYVQGIDVRQGKLLFQLPYGKRGANVNAATPLMIDDEHVFVTASYGIGSKLISVADPQSPQTVWQSDDSLSSQYPTPVFADGYLYGVHGREDIGIASLRCVEAKTGKVAWEKKGFGMAHAIVADDKMIVATVEGEVMLVSLSHEQYQELGKIRAVDSTMRAQPAFSNGVLYLRDSDSVAAWLLPK